jgi:perosamine synthetase
MKVKWSLPDFGEEEKNAAISSLNTYIGANGPEVSSFEKEFAETVNTKHAIAVSNGTTALMVSLMCMKEKYGDLRVGVPSFTFIASANSSQQIFGKDNVKLLDCDRNTWNIDNASVEDIDLLMTVDVGGLPCDYRSLSNLNVPIIADSAESLGSSIDNQTIGSQAPMHCFSLHRAKIVSCGEGGIISTNCDDLNEAARSFLNHGYARNKKSHEYIHDRYGLNFRMADVNAAIARVQLRKLKKYVSHRNKIANIYKNELRGLIKFQEYDTNRFNHNYFFFGVLSDNRDKVVSHMQKKDIEVKTWTAVHKQSIWKRSGLPVASNISDEVVLLPIHNTISESEVSYVIESLKEVL